MRLYCAIVLGLFTIQLTALTILKADYGWIPGQIRNYKEGSWNQSSTDLTPGTGKVWNFTIPSQGYENNTFSFCSNVPAFPNANFIKSDEGRVNGLLIGNNYFQQTIDDFVQLGYESVGTYVWTPGVPTGLPHFFNQTWQGTYNYTSEYGSVDYTISGSVIAEGQLTTHWGTHSAVLVKFHYSSNTEYDAYQWETKEYGIEVFSNSLNGGLVYVLNEAQPNIVASDDQIASPIIQKVTVYPNPSKDIINLQVSTKQPDNLDVSIYNIKGELVFQDKQTANRTITWNGKNLKQNKVMPGIYFYRIDLGRQIATGKFVIIQ